MDNHPGSEGAPEQGRDDQVRRPDVTGNAGRWLSKVTRQQAVIESALAWLDETEPRWKLDEPIDRREFVNGLLARMNRESRSRARANKDKAGLE